MLGSPRLATLQAVCVVSEARGSHESQALERNKGALTHATMLLLGVHGTFHLADPRNKVV